MSSLAAGKVLSFMDQIVYIHTHAWPLSSFLFMSSTWSVGYRPGLVSYRLGKYASFMVSVNLMAVGEFFVIGRFISASQRNYVTQPELSGSVVFHVVGYCC